ncbi:MAG: hypothetical protein CR982_02785 [Candidatus Cloacimonadota bacterium]|nr:MAG: hypothetical protein CR982_02785 [Candidatus Cloacimonadota bacterium]PIE79196.1 MAG: hypothetical protein CSA15_03980 [Candidatus Delongbacteria bacterium]
MSIKFFLLFIISAVLHAEISKDELEESILDKIESIETFKSEFSQEQEWELAGETSVSFGKIYMSGKNIYRIESGENYIIFNNNTVYRYNDETKQLLIELVREEDSGSVVPVKLIFEFPKYFDIADFEESKNGYKIFLTPKKINESFILSLTVYVNDDFIVEGIDVLDIDDNTSKYRLKKMIVNEDIDKELFEQPKDSSIEIMDLR